MKPLFLTLLFILSIFSCTSKTKYETIIRNGTIYDGNGEKPFTADIAINGDTIAFMGDLKNETAKNEIDAKGQAITPGFINMLSWATESLIQDGRSQSDIRQGVTLEVMGEGTSMGPLNPKMKSELQKGQSDIKYKIDWNTLGEYLNFLEKKGISCNVASFIGAGTVRTYVVGEDNRKATPAELDSMQLLVKKAMEEGAMGVGSSLIYPPDFFAGTQELITLCKEASKHGGMYISHMRSEGNKLDEAVEELITISKEANIPAEIYHLKAAGKDNWKKMDGVIKRIEKARAEGLHITADMYTYLAGATGLTASFPPSLQDGGFGKLWLRLQDPVIRAKMAKAMKTNPSDWENLYYGAGSAEKVLLLGFKQDSLKKYTGKTLAEVAKIKGKSPEETAMDLIVQDSTRIGAAYFLMNEENVKKQVALPWVSFGSDEGSYTPEGVFLKSQPHPRAYGNFIRVIGQYSRDEKLLTLEKAIYKLAKLPATNLKLKKRGELKVGYYADIVIFDPAKVKDLATYDKPQQFASGISDVFVNGVAVLKNGEHTGATPGRFVKGPGYVQK
ncbi:N-acyl-D-amino-acid deacylase family protein [Dyadobacter frigoris]|uniref:D-aminoacylase n=1 Tax=Dyadobacter frigoris TaxID=2576211 RepID=A0A4U6D0Y2_9BACT|nr:D-aminoacylase [Dyadobacter frigoris]TKT89701.1 D-aminoacylase [Dyadobacter frigoris]GLU54073.1 aminoacylase [Dyadobacter frigoris]